MNIFGWFKKIFGAIKNFYVRTNLDRFLGQYVEVAIEIVARLALVNNNAGFAKWKDQAFEAVRDRIGKPVADTWVAILIHLAYENLKAKQPGVARTEVK